MTTEQMLRQILEAVTKPQESVYDHTRRNYLLLQMAHCDNSITTAKANMAGGEKRHLTGIPMIEYIERLERQREVYRSELTPSNQPSAN